MGRWKICKNGVITLSRGIFTLVFDFDEKNGYVIDNKGFIIIYIKAKTLKRAKLKAEIAINDYLLKQRGKVMENESAIFERFGELGLYPMYKHGETEEGRAAKIQLSKDFLTFYAKNIGMYHDIAKENVENSLEKCVNGHKPTVVFGYWQDEQMFLTDCFFIQCCCTGIWMFRTLDEAVDCWNKEAREKGNET